MKALVIICAMDGTFRIRGRHHDHYTNIVQGCTKDSISVPVSMTYLLVYHNWEYREKMGQLLQLFVTFFFCFLHSLQYHTPLGGRLSFAQEK